MYTKLLVLISTLLAIHSAAQAAPGNANQPLQFYLQSVVINGTLDSGCNKDGLFVSAYHTGAGLNDAVLISNFSIASKAYVNDTDLVFSLEASLPYYGILVGDANYAGEHSK